MFDLFILVGMLGGLAFFTPTRIDGDEIFCFYYFALIVISSFVVHPVRKIRFTSCALVLGLALVTTLLNYRTPVRWVFVNTLLGFLTWKVIAERTQLKAKDFGRFLIPIVFAQLILVGLQYFKMEHYYGNTYKELAGSYLNPWQLGCASVLMVPFIFTVCPWLCLLILPLLIVSKSWTCLLLGILLFCVMMDRLQEMILFGIFTLPLATIFLQIYGHAFDRARLIAWKESFAFIHNKWIGNGIGSWAHEGFIVDNGADHYHWQWAHNELYQYGFEQGAIGLALIAILLLSLFLLKERTFKVAFLGIVGLSMAHPVLHFARLIYPIVIILAMASVERGELWAQTK